MPITNGIGESATPGAPGWPRYIRTTDIASLDALDDARRASLPPNVAAPAMLAAGDILMCAAGSVGVAHQWQGREPACYAGYLVRLRVNEQLAHARFVAWWTQSSDYLNQVYAGAVRSTIDNYSAGKYRATTLPLPSLSAQIAIASYLNRETADIDEFIADQEQLIALLEERLRARVDAGVLRDRKELVQVRRLGPRMESGTSVNAENVPAGPGEIGVLKTGSASKGSLDLSENKRVLSTDLERVSGPLRAGTLLVNRANTADLVASAVVVTEEREGLYLSDKLWQIDFKEADVTFMAWWSRTSDYRQQVKLRCVGSSASMQNLAYDNYLNLEVPFYSLDTQGQIAQTLEDELRRLLAAIADAREAIALSRERRAALISAAVTGRIDVTERKRVLV